VLLQAYDYLHLHRTAGVTLQMGGSDQWGNITTGTELIRRMEGGEAFAVTTPLLTKSDGSKFGKSEGGNVWLDAARTSPYKFYQFWLNASDDEAARFAKIFTHWTQDECEALIAEHTKDPGRRKLQKEVAAFITQLVHGEAALQEALAASAVLFGSASVEDIRNLPVAIWEELAATLPGYTTVMDPDASMAEGELAGISRGQIEDSLSVLKLLARSGFLSSFGEAKRAIKEKSISVNGVKITEEGHAFESKDLIHGKYMLLQRGKKTFFVLKAV
jgi:tyrosyl-tRNA synthetase